MIERGVKLLAKGHAVKLLLHRAMEAFTNAVGLRWQLHRNEVFRNEPSRSLIPFTRGIGASFELIAYETARGEYRVYFYNEEQQLIALPANEKILDPDHAFQAPYVSVIVAEPEVAHQVSVKKFNEWLERSHGAPRDTIQRQKVKSILNG